MPHRALSTAALLDGIDTSATGVDDMPGDFPSELLLGLGHRTSFPRQLAERLNDWLGALRSRRSRAMTAGPSP